MWAQPEWWNATQKAKVTVGIVLGMIFIHSPQVVHRDLKPGNTLLAEDYHVKICDFGCAGIEDSIMSFNIGTRGYQAPEMVFGHLYDYKVGVYAFGVILCQIIAGFEIWPDEVKRTCDHKFQA
jgi:serine/threonine protein kinase